MGKNNQSMPKRRMDQIRYYAYKVRDAVERLALDEYEEHANRFNCTETLAGLCARASAMLSWELDRVGIPHNLASGYGHLYIECEELLLNLIVHMDEL
jgi:hypothetical protein